MQRFAYDFYHHLKKIADVDLIANPGNRKTFLPFLLKVLCFLVFNSRKYEVIHLYDAVLSPLIPVIRLFSRARITFTVNGLDIVYSRFGYQKLIPFFLKHADKIIAISQDTKEQCRMRGVPLEKLVVIPVGISTEKGIQYSEFQKLQLASRLNLPVEKKKILLSVGRLVKRKGHAWFVSSVMRYLPDSYTYLIVGLGPELNRIRQTIRELDLSNRVFLLGEIAEEDKNCLYQMADLFIMPNISLKTTREGFGIVVLEAGRYGLPVIAADIEGIRDAVIDGKTGRLVREGDDRGFAEAIINPKLDPAAIRELVLSQFNWPDVAKRYYAEFEKIKLV